MPLVKSKGSTQGEGQSKVERQIIPEEPKASRGTPTMRREDFKGSEIYE